MKRIFFFCLILLLLLICSCKSDKNNKIVKIEFFPWEDYSYEITFVEELNKRDNSALVEKISKANRVTPFFIPKSIPREGKYHIYIYEDTICVGDYEIQNENYIYDTKRECYLKVPDILNTARAMFFMDMLKKNKKEE